MKAKILPVALSAGSLLLAACGSSSSSSSGSAAAANGPQPKVCILSEFKTRPDGVPGLQTTYGASWGKIKYTEIGSTAEKSLGQGSCDAGEVFTTDSAIVANNLVVLQDDKKLFPPDNVGLIVRSSVLKAHPEIAAIIDPIAAKITTDEIKQLNKKVEIDSQKPADVVTAWLATNGSGGSASASGSGTANCPAPSGKATSTSGQGVTINLGSKNFAEEQILAEIAKQSLAQYGFTVNYTTQEADPQIGQDLRSGKIDMYWQYTGTELGTYLMVDKPPTDLDQAFTQAQTMDDPQGLCWIAKAPMDDTNGIAIRQADSAKFGTTLTQFTSSLDSHNGS